jgi:tRNA (cmo5U34)-methyltransferase
MRDEVFNKPIEKQFEFDESVASVFDDMLSRSVPYYQDVIKLISSLSAKNLKDDDIVYDLGCSTATTLLEISRKSDKNIKLVGIDNSEAMLQRAKNKAKAYGADIELINDDILSIPLKEAKIILSNYTLQFIRPIKREELIKKIYDSLEDGGMFIFSEKVISEDKQLNKQLIEEYYEYKKTQGYSEYEIVQKREALENVLVPYSDLENRELLKKCGFKHIEIIFRWSNFSTFIAKK